jgi:hypothetical protein
MSPGNRYAKKQAKAINRRRLNAKERHEPQQRQAQRAIEALHQALHNLGLPADLGPEIEGRLRAQKKRLGKSFGLLCPTLLGCINADALTRTRGWDQHVPRRMLDARPKRSWLKRLRKLGQAILVSLWRPTSSMSEAPRRRWQWTWALADAVLRNYGGTRELVGPWWRGPHKRVVDGMDGVLLLVGLGDGPPVVPVDFAGRRPNPKGPGRRCRPTRGWAQVLLAATLGALGRRGRAWPGPLGGAERWCRDSKWIAHMADPHQGTLLVPGKATYTFVLADGPKGKGAEVVAEEQAWPVRQSLNAPDCRSARRRATRPTSGAVTGIIVAKPGEKRFDLLGCATSLQATR